MVEAGAAAASTRRRCARSSTSFPRAPARSAALAAPAHCPHASSTSCAAWPRARSTSRSPAELDLSASTVRSHLHNVYGKLGALDRAQAVLMATDTGLDLDPVAQAARGRPRCRSASIADVPHASPSGRPRRSGGTRRWRRRASASAAPAEHRVAHMGLEGPEPGRRQQRIAGEVAELPGQHLPPRERVAVERLRREARRSRPSGRRGSRECATARPVRRAEL